MSDTKDCIDQTRTRKRKCPSGEQCDDDSATPTMPAEAKPGRGCDGDDAPVDPSSSSSRLTSVVESWEVKHDNDESSSVEALLAVPVDFIFFECRSLQATGGSAPPHRRRTLLSRSEAAVLLRTSQLASEMDVLQSVASAAMDRARLCRGYGEWIARNPSTNAYVRSVLPLLSVHGVRVPSQAVSHIAAETERVLSELERCAIALRQFAEQNWSVAESLRDAFGLEGGEAGEPSPSVGAGAASAAGNGLGREKRIAGEVEEAVCTRIEGLLSMASTGVIGETNSDTGAKHGDVAVDAFETVMDIHSGNFVPMRDLCRRLLGKCEGRDIKSFNRLENRDSNNTGGDILNEMDVARGGADSTSLLKVAMHEVSKVENSSSASKMEESNAVCPAVPTNYLARLNKTNEDGSANQRKGKIGNSQGTDVVGHNTQDAVAALTVLAST